MLLRAARLLAAPVILLAGVRCAHVEPPSGGPEDTIPPRVAAVYPAPEAVAVPADARIILQFTEWIDRGASRGTAMISPPYAGRVQVEVEGDRLIIRPPAGQALRANTTHVVSVMGSLKDLRGNALGEVFTLRFTTGPALDSAGVDGVMTRDGQRGPLLVALYQAGDRTAVKPVSLRDTGFTIAAAAEPWRELPAAIAGADATGRFTLTGAAPGEYALFAFEDVNGNFAFDVGLEAAAPGDPTLALRPRAATQSLRLTPLDTLPLRIVDVAFTPDGGGSAEAPAGALTVTFSRAPHPVRAAEASRYLVVPDSGEPVAVTGAEWSPQRAAWVLETPPLRAGVAHRLVMRARPDFPARFGADEPDTSAPFDVAAFTDTGNADTANAPAWTLTPLAVDDDGTGLSRAAVAPGNVRQQVFASNHVLTSDRWHTLLTELEARTRGPRDTVFTVLSHTLQRRGPLSVTATWARPPAPGHTLEVRLRRPGGIPGDTTDAPRVLYSGTVPDTAQARRLKVAAPAERTDWIFWAEPVASAGGAPVMRYPLRVAGDSLVSAPLPRGRYRVHGFQDRDGDRIWNPGAIRPWIPQEPYAVQPDTVTVDVAVPD